VRRVPPVAIALLVLAVAVGPAASQQPARHATEREVYEVASQLRCVVCQNLSVADSPSEMAAQMRGIVRERLASGETPQQVTQYFVDKYGDWILLSPRRHGFTLLVWIAPFAAVLVGLLIAAALVRRWTRRSRHPRDARPVDVSAAMRERIRREMDAER